MTDEMKPINGWNEWSRFVLKELERLNTCYEKIDAKADTINNKMSMLQIKVAGIGAASGIITTLIFLLLSYLLKGQK